MYDAYAQETHTSGWTPAHVASADRPTLETGDAVNARPIREERLQ